MFEHKNSNPQNPKRVVILGGNGFIGNELCAKLESQNVPYLKIASKDIDLTQDGADKKLAAQLDKDDSLVFLSALTPDKGKGIDAFDKNMRMAINVTRAVEIQPIAHLVYFSSDAIYSMQETIVNEETKPNPQDMYGLMHFSRERLISQSFKDTAVIRPTLVYGLKDTHNSYGPNRLRRMASEKAEITLFGEGAEKRDHILVQDLIEIVWLTLQWKSIGDLNAVTGHSISYLDLANKIASLYNREIKVITGEQTQPITHRHFDNAQVFKAFPSFQFTELEKGLESVHREMLEAAA